MKKGVLWIHKLNLSVNWRANDGNTSLFFSFFFFVVVVVVVEMLLYVHSK